MAIELNEEDAVDRGQPNRPLHDGTHQATIFVSEEYVKNTLSLKVEVCVHPGPKLAPLGPVICTTYIPTELSEKVRDLNRLHQYAKACGHPGKGSFEGKEQVGKPIQVVTKWQKSRDPQWPDRAEIVGFLPPLKGQAPMPLPPVDETPF